MTEFLWSSHRNLKRFLSPGTAEFTRLILSQSDQN